MKRRSSAALLLAAALLCGCGEPTGSADRPGVPATLAIAAGDGQLGAPGMPLGSPITVRVLDRQQRPVADARVEFGSLGGGFTLADFTSTDASGVATTVWYLGATGEQRLTVTTSGGVADTARATLLPVSADSTYRGREGYIEYTPGTLPLIISAPHGGSLRPAEIPDRTSGTTVTDMNTEELARAVADALEQRTGERPHLVISRLHRIKLDPNRELSEGAGESRYAQHAWREWMTFLSAAHASVDGGGGGLYLDLHGHGHEIARLELGYLTTAAELALSDDALAAPAIAARSSVRALVQRSGHSLPALLRGDHALGSLLQDAGYPAVPSRQQPHPGTAPYFTGGYDTERFGSRNRGSVDAIQIESHYTGVRNTAEARAAFAAALADALQAYFPAHYGRAFD